MATATQTIMPPEEFKALRAQLGLTMDEMAAALGYPNRCSVAHMESGRKAIKGPLLIAVRSLMKSSPQKPA